MSLLDLEMQSKQSSVGTGAEKQPFDAAPLDDIEEKRAIFAVLDSFRQYRKQTHFTATHRRRQNFYALPREHQALINELPLAFLDTLTAVDDAIDENADLADAILTVALPTLGLGNLDDSDGKPEWHDSARAEDLNKAHSTVRQFWRDWSREGYEAEVRPILDLVMRDLAKHNVFEADNTKILLPGAGLGRLLFELCLSGYNVEGNEISYHQLFASNFILNTTQHAGQFLLYPNVTTFTNHISRASQLAAVSVPDVHPSTAILERTRLAEQDKTRMVRPPGQMDMTAGDFITSYNSASSANEFDAVVTVYFLDTAPNVLRYIETIRNCLRAQGLWINVGPLLWHFEDRMVDQHDEHKTTLEHRAEAKSRVHEGDGIAEPGSFELTDEEVRALVVKMGFEILAHELRPESEGGYISDPVSMLQSRYRSSHWIARKI